MCLEQILLGNNVTLTMGVITKTTLKATSYALKERILIKQKKEKNRPLLVHEFVQYIRHKANEKLSKVSNITKHFIWTYGVLNQDSY